MGKKPQDIESERILLATGSVPRTLPGLKIDGKVVMTSDEAIMHPEVPRSVVIIGGGYIGMEFAYVYNSFGSKVTIVEMEKQILPGADEEIAKEAKKIIHETGNDNSQRDRIQIPKENLRFRDSNGGEHGFGGADDPEGRTWFWYRLEEKPLQMRRRPLLLSMARATAWVLKMWALSLTKEDL